MSSETIQPYADNHVNATIGNLGNRLGTLDAPHPGWPRNFRRPIRIAP